MYLGKVYPECALTHAPASWLEWVGNDDSKVKQSLRDAGIEVLNFQGLVKGTTMDVYRHDFEYCVPCADLALFFGDVPSIGGGMEIGAGLWRYHKNIAVFVERGCKLSRAVTGTVECGEYCITYHEYDQDRPDLLTVEVAVLLKRYRRDGPGLVSESSDVVYAHQEPFVLYPKVYAGISAKGKMIKVHDDDRQVIRVIPSRAWTEEEIRSRIGMRKILQSFTSNMVTTGAPTLEMPAVDPRLLVPA